MNRAPAPRLTSPSIALLPIRFFFGATFLWAGLDKFLDPDFFDAAAPTSLHSQLIAFSRASPLGGLIELMLPYAVVVGFLIAVAEIGIGIGALTGLAFRVAAFGGAALSTVLWLTASWGTHPYYLGADLPYAVGWIALLIGGPGEWLVPARWRSSSAAAARRTDVSPERRVFLQTATLAAIAAIIASFTPFIRALGVVTGEASRSHGLGGGPSAGPGGTADPSVAATATGTTPPATGVATPPSPSAAPPTVPPGAIPVSTVAAVTSKGAVSFMVPFNAPAPLPAGDPAVIVQKKDGSFVAFDAVCTHAGCTVEWDKRDHVLFCPCHDAIFDAENDAAVLDGPAPAPLTSLPIVIDPATGKILLDPTA
ncbi:MAG TPA: Rieske 2Fe-2S domain-containing protein [Candidatus Limnocylindrales bacterium]|nr:Rieske 2Fe-2S domain-containing protein [Candidatus Limnocylindrales bacterium]